MDAYERHKSRRRALHDTLRRHGVTANNVGLLVDDLAEQIRALLEGGDIETTDMPPAVRAFAKAGVRIDVRLWGIVQDRADAMGIEPGTILDASTAWQLCGYNPKNVTGQLEWAATGQRGGQPSGQGQARSANVGQDGGLYV